MCLVLKSVQISMTRAIIVIIIRLAAIRLKAHSLMVAVSSLLHQVNYFVFQCDLLTSIKCPKDKFFIL